MSRLVKSLSRSTASAMALSLSLITSDGFAQGQEPDALKEVQPPEQLVDVLTVPADGEAAKRAKLGWDAVQKQTELKKLPKAIGDGPVGVLNAQAARLIEQSEQAMTTGEVFRAIELLRQAEAQAGSHPTIDRALGLAYTASGNRVRGATYLSKVIQRDPKDVAAILLLAQHAAQSGELGQVFALCKALEQAKAPAPLSELYRARALDRLGYTAAAASRLEVALSGLETIDPQSLATDGKTDPTVVHELALLKALGPQLTIEQGDLLMSLGAYERAATAYAAVDPDRVARPATLAVRQIYLALRTGKPGEAIELAAALLNAPTASTRDAELIDYLVGQGVERESLAKRLAALINEGNASLPLLTGLAKVADKSAVLEEIAKWLMAKPVDPARLRQAVSLVTFDDSNPDDAKPLAKLFVLVADLMSQHPDEANAYALAAVDEINAPVSLLRALRSPEFAGDQDAYRQLFSALGYEATRRKVDAIERYQLALNAEPKLRSQAELPLARLLLDQDRAKDAIALLKEAGADDPWERFDVTMRAMAQTGKVSEAIAMVEQRAEARGKDIASDLLRIELIAQRGTPQQACNLLLRLISSHPQDEKLYRLGIDLIYEYQSKFASIHDAERMQRAFITRLTSNLPESATAQIYLAYNILSNPARLDEAEQLLQSAAKEQPGNIEALGLLVQIYDMTGDDDAADAAHRKQADAMGLGVSRSLLIASRAVSFGEMKRATDELQLALALDEEGVLPGPAMTGDQANSVLRYLDAAEPDQDHEALSLKMVKRFPDNPGLNNGLGYRWVVEGKNLLQAKAMIERALEKEGMDHSLLDSLAWVQYKLGRFEEAAATQRRALLVLEALLARVRGVDVGQAATKAILNDHMGDILFKQGDEKGALEHWREALKQRFDEEEMMFDPELRTLGARLKAKIDAMARDEQVPVSPVPGPDAHGPEGHPADQPDPAGEKPAE